MGGPRDPGEVRQHWGVESSLYRKGDRKRVISASKGDRLRLNGDRERVKMQAKAMICGSSPASLVSSGDRKRVESCSLRIWSHRR